MIMELFNFVLLFIVQESVAQYVLPPNLKLPSVGSNLYNLPSLAPQNVYNPQTYYPSSPNGADIFNGYPPSDSQYIGQLPNYHQSGLTPMPNSEQILKQHITDWRTLQTIVNNFFDSISKFAETFMPTPSVFGGTSQNSLLNPANLNALNEIYVSLKYVTLGFIRIIKNFLGSLKYLIQYFASSGNMNINNVIGQVMKGFLQFWMFK